MPRCFTSLAVLVVFVSLTCRAEEISPAGRWLAEKVDAMDVEHLWLAKQTVSWKTGEPLAKQTGNSGTHCSAFVAAACMRLGIYILRPPEHSAAMLANAQYDWLFKSGREQGWTQLPDGHRAQHFANQGYLVVAVFKEDDPKRHGHIAIVRPSTKSPGAIDAEGPQVTQAGGHNARSTSLKHGFGNHPDAFGKQRVRYFAHKVETREKVSIAEASGTVYLKAGIASGLMQRNKKHPNAEDNENDKGSKAHVLPCLPILSLVATVVESDFRCGNEYEQSHARRRVKEEEHQF
jgi:hypothetical protein